MMSFGHLHRGEPLSVLESAPPPIVPPPPPYYPASYPPLHNDASSLSPSLTTPQYPDYSALGVIYQPNIQATWGRDCMYPVQYRSYKGGS